MWQMVSSSLLQEGVESEGVGDSAGGHSEIEDAAPGLSTLDAWLLVRDTSTVRGSLRTLVFQSGGQGTP